MSVLKKRLSTPIYASRFFANNYKNQENVIFDGAPKKRRKCLPKPLREKVWRKRFASQLDGTCHICKFHAISAFNFHCGHIISVAEGGTDDLSNLEPICAGCNLSMSTENMNNFYKRIWPFETNYPK